MSQFTLKAKRAVTREGLQGDVFVRVEDGYIAAIESEPKTRVGVYDLGECDLLPGFIDLHSDCWLETGQPRPSYRFPFADSLLVLDTQAVGWGITTHYTCVAVHDDLTKYRTIAVAEEQVETLTAMRPQLRADHRIHLRVELAGAQLNVVERLAASSAVSMLSYMDHTPGQGQYADEESWRRAQAASANATDTRLDAVLQQQRAAAHRLHDTRANLSKLADQMGLTLGSHDDDPREAIARASALGVRVAEFPVTLAAAQAACDAGILTVMGAPNALRGRSLYGSNLSAREALNAGYLGALASDYYPPALLRAVYRLAAEGLCSFEAAVALATSGPATAANLTDRGRIEVGTRADLIAVSNATGQPLVSQTWIAGAPAFPSASAGAA